MRFRGFTLPDGAYLPSELVYLLPHTSEARLKVLIAVIYHNTQFGGAEPLSLTDIERITGLSRQSVISATKGVVDDGILERQVVGNSYTYAPVVRQTKRVVQNLDYSEGSVQNLDQFSGKTVQNLDYPEQVKLSQKEPSSEDNFSDLLNSRKNGQNFGQSEHAEKIQALRAAGVYLKTAQALAEKNDLETIQRHIEYYQYALTVRLANGPGYLVSSLKEDWSVPLGYMSEAEQQRQEEQKRLSYVKWDSSNRRERDNGESD